MKTANNIMDILNMVAAAQVHQDTLAEFTEKAPTKEELKNANKKSTNFKWAAIDGALSIGNFVLNQYRQKQFENIEQNAADEAEVQMKEREERIQNLKDNLGITDLEKKIDEQNKMLEEISKSLAHLSKVARNMEIEKEAKHIEMEGNKKFNKKHDLLPTTNANHKKEEDDDDWT